MKNHVHNYVTRYIKTVEDAVNVAKERKREPEYGTPEYDEWLKIYHLGMYTACSEILECIDNGRAVRSR